LRCSHGCDQEKQDEQSNCNSGCAFHWRLSLRAMSYS
jgi:hypothetical protein